MKHGWIFLSAALATTGAEAAAKPVSYACADGTRLQATFRTAGTAAGSATLVIDGSSSRMVLPQALSADGGRYAKGDVEFWIKGQGATLTRAGSPTTCAVAKAASP
ncbi:MliC family protein [Microvirga rosea]|uniref:MliC family protein n=1 Tax=Microvirga rosea TaxID=2715425 RepID=UPI001D0A905A|nr:MliC family protein [Microvirga rosea]MCB8820888.1 MliC family protein [Microvirga rosea]